MAAKAEKPAYKADPAELAAMIRSGGNIIERLEQWAHKEA